MCPCKSYNLHEGPYTFSVTQEVHAVVYFDSHDIVDLLHNTGLLHCALVCCLFAKLILQTFLKFATTRCLATSVQLCKAMLMIAYRALGVEMVKVNTEQK